ncbi:DUF2508 family protein [Clostridium thermobutyricum]|uniref:DUF2508 family protein n=1 Tax=Clostridium thermobutyricum TaxID=29372 RepID=UPI0018AB99AB|nr:DUF2508 family protein [Clostridium thermobutyricum]
MKKSNIKEYFNNILGNRSEKDYILEQISATKAEMEIASSAFDNVKDPLLIEVAIYAERAAMKRYSYFIELAKKKGIVASNGYIIENCTRLAEY